ncbi:leucine-rich repeat transmembrane protein FLRT3-like isoform X4 [Bolinopsis microptera]|uniref:leucine-rich repeat transmembrane protein FLRT3-like isoform X4 n=1 Tax=Bolinopsis microptera TaxID=2820187 RepID=UPI0030798D85
MQNVRTTLLTTIILPLFLQVIQTETKVSSYDDLSCGTLLGDYRYCLDYSNKSLTKPPEGTNVTSILNLSNNKIKTIGEERFKSQRLLMKLDLSHNDISNIDPDALKHLKSLTEIKLGNNPYVCEASICSFRNWLFGNMHMVKDIKSVTCIGPVALRGQKIIELDADSVCSNGTIHHGFEINTETLMGLLILLVMIVIVLAIFGIRERISGRVVVPAGWQVRILRNDFQPNRNQAARQLVGMVPPDEARNEASASHTL